MNKLSLLLIIIVSFVIYTSCKKEEEKTNQKPTCEIKVPSNGQQVIKGEIITVSVDAEDKDGGIFEVRFFIDGIGKSSITSFPYTYDWNTDNENFGSHSIKATSLDNDGGSVSDEISVTVIAGASGTGTFTDPRDGQTYITVEIGNQTWMAENLNYQSDDSWWYDNSNTNGDIYGRLYTWDAAQTACPAGWHLPSDDEWKILEIALGMSQSGADSTEWRGTNEGGKLKEIGTNHWKLPNTGAINSNGFTALPGGYCKSDGSFGGLGDVCCWWSSTENADAYAWGRDLTYDNNKIYRFYGGLKTYGYSVRCLKD